MSWWPVCADAGRPPGRPEPQVAAGRLPPPSLERFEGALSALLGPPRSPVERELRERAAGKGRPLTLRNGTSVFGSFSARIPGLDLHVPPGARGGLPTQLSLPAVSWDVWAWNAGRAKPLNTPSWPPLPGVGDQPPWTPEPARRCGLLRVGPSPALDSELPAGRDVQFSALSVTRSCRSQTPSPRPWSSF